MSACRLSLLRSNSDDRQRDRRGSGPRDCAGLSLTESKRFCKPPMWVRFPSGPLGNRGTGPESDGNDAGLWTPRRWFDSTRPYSAQSLGLAVMMQLLES